VLLFLISGFKLPSEAIKAGMKDIRVHILIQLFVFAISPWFIFATSFPFRDIMDGRVVIGIYALACLPTTISSCIVFTQISGGNVVATMFNAAFANVVGIILSPLLLSIMVRSSGSPLPLSELLGILQSLALKMLLPIIAGQIARRYAGGIGKKIGKPLGTVSSIFILLIVFFAFSKTAGNSSFRESLVALIVPFVYLAAVHLVLLGASYFSAKALHFSTENTISVLFAAPQKTLAMGVPLISTFFADNPEILGTALLPLIFYHAWQLFIAGFLPRLTAKLPRSPEPAA
jgi:sodium/bile acid cotransporter 7